MIFKWQTSLEAWARLRERLPHAILIQSGEGMGEFEFAQACATSLAVRKARPDEHPAACNVQATTSLSPTATETRRERRSSAVRELRHVGNARDSARPRCTPGADDAFQLLNGLRSEALPRTAIFP